MSGFFLNSLLFHFREGDIFFQDLDCGPPCEAIEAVTQGYNGSQLSHCAIITAVGPSYQETILTEAIGDYVIETTLEEFLNRSNDKVIVGRLKNDYQYMINDTVEHTYLLIFLVKNMTLFLI